MRGGAAAPIVTPMFSDVCIARPRVECEHLSTKSEDGQHESPLTQEPMNEVTRILSAAGKGDPEAASKLLPLVYDELRRLAAQRLASERPGHTLQATALVHEAYLRLVDVQHVPHWDGRGHFFAAAAEAMRRILIDSARRKRRPKHGGDLQRINLDEAVQMSESPGHDLLALD